MARWNAALFFPPLYIWMMIWIGNSLEQSWGAFSPDHLLFAGMLGVTMVSFLLNWGQTEGNVAPFYINTSLFFAFRDRLSKRPGLRPLDHSGPSEVAGIDQSTSTPCSYFSLAIGWNKIALIFSFAELRGVFFVHGNFFEQDTGVSSGPAHEIYCGFGAVGLSRYIPRPAYNMTIRIADAIRQYTFTFEETRERDRHHPVPVARLVDCAKRDVTVSSDRTDIYKFHAPALNLTPVSWLEKLPLEQKTHVVQE